MTIQLINPADLPPQATYTQVVVAAGTAVVFVAGQEPEDVHGNSVAPGDLAGQARQVYANLGRALIAAGARPDQVAKLTIYVVGYKSECLPVIEQARVELFGDHKPADTLIGVAGPARVPHRGRRDCGEVRSRQLREIGVSRMPEPRRASTRPGNHARPLVRPTCRARSRRSASVRPSGLPKERRARRDVLHGCPSRAFKTGGRYRRLAWR